MEVLLNLQDTSIDPSGLRDMLHERVDARWGNILMNTTPLAQENLKLES